MSEVRTTWMARAMTNKGWMDLYVRGVMGRERGGVHSGVRDGGKGMEKEAYTWGNQTPNSG